MSAYSPLSPHASLGPSPPPRPAPASGPVSATLGPFLAACAQRGLGGGWSEEGLDAHLAAISATLTSSSTSVLSTSSTTRHPFAESLAPLCASAAAAAAVAADAAALASSATSPAATSPAATSPTAAASTAAASSTLASKDRRSGQSDPPIARAARARAAHARYTLSLATAADAAAAAAAVAEAAEALTAAAADAAAAAAAAAAATTAATGAGTGGGGREGEVGEEDKYEEEDMGVELMVSAVTAAITACERMRPLARALTLPLSPSPGRVAGVEYREGEEGGGLVAVASAVWAAAHAAVTSTFPNAVADWAGKGGVTVGTEWATEEESTSKEDGSRGSKGKWDAYVPSSHCTPYTTPYATPYTSSSSVGRHTGSRSHGGDREQVSLLTGARAAGGSGPLLATALPLLAVAAGRRLRVRARVGLLGAARAALRALAEAVDANVAAIDAAAGAAAYSAGVSDAIVSSDGNVSTSSGIPNQTRYLDRVDGYLHQIRCRIAHTLATSVAAPLCLSLATAYSGPGAGAAAGAGPPPRGAPAPAAAAAGEMHVPRG